MKFVDFVKIYVKAGDGGKGCVSFRREKYVPKGGPDGGDGGRGADIIVKADGRLHTLLDHRYKKRYIGKDGQQGMGSNMHGKDGERLLVKVPIGTMVIDASNHDILADLNEEGMQVIVAKGGKGGLGNSHFATPVRQVPRYAQPGLPGEEMELVLELKLLADVGIIGLPNSGKSTLISVISAARPKIADYPFTTLVPNLGVVKYSDFKSFVVADIPGLIEGAHRGAGLGHQFLRHVERTSILIHVIDISDMTEGDVVDNYLTVNSELEHYARELINKSQVVVASKIDIANGDKVRMLRDYCAQNGIKLFEISAVTHQGIDALVERISSLLEKEYSEQ